MSALLLLGLCLENSSDGVRANDADPGWETALWKNRKTVPVQRRCFTRNSAPRSSTRVCSLQTVASQPVDAPPRSVTELLWTLGPAALEAPGETLGDGAASALGRPQPRAGTLRPDPRNLCAPPSGWERNLPKDPRRRPASRALTDHRQQAAPAPTLLEASFPNSRRRKGLLPTGAPCGISSRERIADISHVP